jgi:hypothetical protein
MHVTPEPVELGDNDRAPRLPSLRKRRSQLRASIERIATFAGLDLRPLANDADPLRFSESVNGRTLGFDAESGATLPRG